MRVSRRVDPRRRTGLLRATVASRRVAHRARRRDVRDRHLSAGARSLRPLGWFRGHADRPRRWRRGRVLDRTCALRRPRAAGSRSASYLLHDALMILVYRAGRQTGRTRSAYASEKICFGGRWSPRHSRWPSRQRRATSKSTTMTLNLVAYSTPKPVMTKIISGLPADARGPGVTFNASYGGSSAQAAAVEAGLPADIAAPQHRRPT